MNYTGDREMSRRYKEELVSLKIAACGEPSIARKRRSCREAFLREAQKKFDRGNKLHYNC